MDHPPEAEVQLGPAMLMRQGAPDVAPSFAVHARASRRWANFLLGAETFAGNFGARHAFEFGFSATEEPFRVTAIVHLALPSRAATLTLGPPALAAMAGFQVEYTPNDRVCTAITLLEGATIAGVHWPLLAGAMSVRIWERAPWQLWWAVAAEAQGETLTPHTNLVVRWRRPEGA